MQQGLGVYIHIPFCIQRCGYCDFATYSRDQIQANDNYIDHLLKELESRKSIFGPQNLSTIYFGGGTPSLLSAAQIDRIIGAFQTQGFQFQSDIEITLEVNPATLSEEKCQGLLQAGVNRLSLGCQTFSDAHLKMCGREHDAKQTLDTIDLIKKYFSNYSLDLLFSLPEQGMNLLKNDLEILTDVNPPHISAYCLTLKDRHPLNQDRASDEEQVAMFSLIEDSFTKIGLHRYEISNFAKPGFESRHNNLYWTDRDYWGLGLSAHSYQSSPDYGTRFWNPSSYDSYISKVAGLSPQANLHNSFSPNEKEHLKFSESLSDYCHTHLRLSSGIPKSSLRQKFGTGAFHAVSEIMLSLQANNLIVPQEDSWSLTPSGLLVSNQVFASLLFEDGDIDKA